MDTDALSALRAMRGNVTFDLYDWGRAERHLLGLPGGDAQMLEATAPTIAGWLYDDLLGNPILADYLQMRERAGHNYRARRPLDVVGEQLSTALLVLSETPMRGGEQLSSTVDTHTARVGLAHSLYCATPYLWADAMRLTALASAVPPHVIARSLLPCPLMWWCFESGAAVEMDGVESVLDSVLVMHSEQGIVVVAFGQHGNGAACWPMPPIPYGASFPDDFDGDMRLHTENVLALLSFLNSPYVAPARERPDRAERRRLARARPDAVCPEVCVIRLRTPKGRTTQRHGEGDGREYSHRWMVRGHHRAQWYPSEQAHHVIWVAPYIKGPPDKPFHSPLYAVVR